VSSRGIDQSLSPAGYALPVAVEEGVKQYQPQSQPQGTPLQERAGGLGTANCSPFSLMVKEISPNPEVYPSSPRCPDLADGILYRQPC